MIYFMKLNDKLEFDGFYVEGLHDEIPEGCFPVDEELHEALLPMNFKAKPSLLTLKMSEECLTIDNLHMFEEYENTSPPPGKTPNEILQEENDALKERLRLIEEKLGIHTPMPL